MAKRKRTNGQTMIYKTIHEKLKIGFSGRGGSSCTTNQKQYGVFELVCMDKGILLEKLFHIDYIKATHCMVTTIAKSIFKVYQFVTNRDNMHSVQVYVIRFVNDLVLRFPFPMKMTNMIKLKYSPQWIKYPQSKLSVYLFQLYKFNQIEFHLP